tara:strand:- start:1324 stop:1425 length:102 start_codon:yes stop_codon:yes gene_type:complete
MLLKEGSNGCIPFISEQETGKEAFLNAKGNALS